MSVLSVLERAASGREWDMNNAAANENIEAVVSANNECRALREARDTISFVLTSASDLLDVLDKYPENPVPMNRNSATVNQLREALARAGVK